LAEGRLPADERERALRHIEGCDPCRVLVATFGASLDAAHEENVDARYQLIEELGRGGMGVVYRAHDALLQRDIALKLIHPGWAGDADRRTRLIRESRAMAKLRHPHVAHVYDAGELDGEVFFAMELVEGQTLREWLAAQRSPEEIVACFVQAGRGLEAAHAAGIVHRDFKPDNVLIDAEGRPLVTDFGLARATDLATQADDGDSPTSSVVTRPGLAAGTPAYMAPEQLEGGAVDAKADVFAFCVALWEALYGLRPFVEDSVAARQQAIEDGAVQRGRAVGPRRIRAVLREGLRARPSSRIELARLLSVLESRPRRRRLAVAAGVVGLGLLAALRSDPQQCPEPPSIRFQGRDDFEQIRARLLERSPTRGALRWTELEPRLLQARGQLDERHARACRTDELDDPAVVAQLRCIELETRVHEALLDIAGEGNTQVLHALEGSNPFDLCELSSPEGLQAEFGAPLEITGHDALVRALAMNWGEFDDSGPIDMADRIQLRWLRPSKIVQARALMWDAVRLDARGLEIPAAERFRRAYALVEGLPVPHLRYAIAIEGVELDDKIDHELWHGRASEAIEDMDPGRGRDRAGARLVLADATDAALEGDLELAESKAREALSLAERSAPSLVWKASHLLSLLGGSDMVESAFDLLRIADDQFGMRSPQSFQELSVAMPILAAEGRMAEVYEIADEALERASATLVEDSSTASNLSDAVYMAALMYVRDGRRQSAERALELAEQAQAAVPGRLPERRADASYRCGVLRALEADGAIEQCLTAWRLVRTMPGRYVYFALLSGLDAVVLLVDAGRMDEAYEVSRQMDALPVVGTLRARIARAYVAVHTGRYEAALVALEGGDPESAPGYPFQPEGYAAMIELIRAEATRALGDTVAAAKLADAALAKAPPTHIAATCRLHGRIASWRSESLGR